MKYVVMMLSLCTVLATASDCQAQAANPASGKAQSDATQRGDAIAHGQVTAPRSSADVPQPVAGAPISPEYVSAVGRMAYLWGWPLVNMHNRQTLFAKAPKPGLLGGVLPVAPLNQLSMLSDYLAPEQRFVTSPNQDVVYGAGFLALEKDAVVLQVPDFGDRFWVYQVVNQRSDSFAEMGIQYGTPPGMYLLVGPDWNGDVPKGIKAVYRSQTNLGAVFPRIFMDDTAEDRKAIQPLIDRVLAYPLSDYTGSMQTTDWSKSPTLPNPNAGGDARRNGSCPSSSSICCRR
jgi:hypothetical protein